MRPGVEEDINAGVRFSEGMSKFRNAKRLTLDFL